MARDFNQTRIANAKLVSANIDRFGRTFAIQSPWNADGFSNVNVTVEQAPTNIKQYLEGDNSITVYPVPSNVDKLCEYALASFPNIQELYLFKNDGVVVISDSLSYLTNLRILYVASDYLSSYSAYTIIHSGYDSFTSVDDYIGYVVVYNASPVIVNNDNKNDLGIVAGTTVAYDRYASTIVEDYTLTIPYVGASTLTSEYVDSVIAMLSNAEKSAITKLVIPTDFSEESADEIAWNYDFSSLVNLDNNIWYGATQYNFTTLTISGSGTLTSAIVESAIASIPSGKLSGITKVVVPSSFTSLGSSCFSPLPNIKTIEIASSSALNSSQPDSPQGTFDKKSTAFNGLNNKINLIYTGGDTLTLRNSLFEDIFGAIFESVDFSACSNSLRFNNRTTGEASGYQVNKVILGKGFTRASLGNRNLGRSGLYFDGQVSEANFTFESANYDAGESIFFCKDGVLQLNGSNVLSSTITDYKNISYSTAYTRDDLLMLLNALYDYSGGSSHTLTIGATNLAKLTAEDVAIATDKNWLVQ